MKEKKSGTVDEQSHCSTKYRRSTTLPETGGSAHIIPELLAGSEAITQVHLAEALQYRPKLDLM